jgi:hypothetical protein
MSDFVTDHITPQQPSIEEEDSDTYYEAMNEQLDIDDYDALLDKDLSPIKSTITAYQNNQLYKSMCGPAMKPFTDRTSLLCVPAHVTKTNYTTLVNTLDEVLDISKLHDLLSSQVSVVAIVVSDTQSRYFLWNMYGRRLLFPEIEFGGGSINAFERFINAWDGQYDTFTIYLLSVMIGNKLEEMLKTSEYKVVLLPHVMIANVLNIPVMMKVGPNCGNKIMLPCMQTVIPLNKTMQTWLNDTLKINADIEPKQCTSNGLTTITLTDNKSANYIGVTCAIVTCLSKLANMKKGTRTWCKMLDEQIGMCDADRIAGATIGNIIKNVVCTSTKFTFEYGLRTISEKLLNDLDVHLGGNVKIITLLRNTPKLTMILPIILFGELLSKSLQAPVHYAM